MVCCDWLSIRFYLLRLILRDRFSFGAKQCWVWRRNSDRLGSKATAGLRQAPMALMPRMRLNLNLIWGGANVQAVDMKSLSTSKNSSARPGSAVVRRTDSSRPHTIC